jgi:hypothetical protein
MLLKPEEVTSLLERAVATAKQSAPCDRVLSDNVVRAYFQSVPRGHALLSADPTAELRIARCAEAAHYYMLMATLARALPSHPELLTRAALGMGDDEQALDLARKDAKKRPDDGNARVTNAKVLCRLEQYDACLKEAEAAARCTAPTDAMERAEINKRALKYRATALTYLGRLEAAGTAVDEAEKAGADAADVKALRLGLVEAGRTGVVVREQHVDDLYLGIYHLFGHTGPRPGEVLALSNIRLTNSTPRARELLVDVQIPGVTTKGTRKVTLLGNATETVALSPQLDPSFQPASVRAPLSADLRVTIRDVKGELLHEESSPLQVHPRDTLPMREIRDKVEMGTRPILSYAVAWVTPNAKPIEQVLTSAKKRMPWSKFMGEQSTTVNQVRALFDELKARGMSYVMDPSLGVDGGTFAQRTRLPSEVLESTNAQCLEGTLLYATLFEAIGLRPMLVFVPGHAFVGWRGAPKDKGALDGWFYLETTMTGTASFDQALVVARKRIEQEKTVNTFRAKRGFLVDVAARRKMGFTPMP